jgi:hypothetical protein
VHFSFKWNDAFCTKQRRFTHYSLKKNEEQGVVFTTLYIIFFLWTRKGREEKVFLPLLCSTSLSLSLSLKPKKTNRGDKPCSGAGVAAQWPPQPPYLFARSFILYAQRRSTTFIKGWKETKDEVSLERKTWISSRIASCQTSYLSASENAMDS